MSGSPLIIVGASARAAAMSAIRAGFSPWCVDLFADFDLKQIAPVKRCDPDYYPQSINECLADAPDAPLMYTGALENHPSLIKRWARRRLIAGNSFKVVRQVRNPELLSHGLRNANIATPEVQTSGRIGEQWLVKPLRGAGGRGIRVGDDRSVPRSHYAQRRVVGESVSGIYSADEWGCQFLGATRQLVGINWLHAQPWHYCGSIGPLHLTTDELRQWRRIGDALFEQFQLRGVFGVDAVIEAQTVCVVEVNPRYTSSVEVLELATGCSAMNAAAQTHKPAIVGKAVYYAPNGFRFPGAGPWDDDLERVFDPWRMPGFADIPCHGEEFQAGNPVISCFIHGSTILQCERRLQSVAEKLDQLFGVG